MVARTLKSESGQVIVEWLLLIAMAFITAYILIQSGPLPDYTSKMLADIRTRLGNIVRNGEMDSTGMEQGAAGHPSDRRRMKALHL